MTDFTHLDKNGRIQMVDVGGKAATFRLARARGTIAMAPETLARILDHQVRKGNVLETARIAGIMAAKQTAALIPLCHPLNLTHIGIDFFPDRQTSTIAIEAAVSLTGPTGVEMEALTAVSIAALTIYDMCKALDRGMTIGGICLVEKQGGKSGTYLRNDAHAP